MQGILPILVGLVSMAFYGWIVIFTRDLAMKYGAINAAVFYQPIMMMTMLCVFGGMRVAQVPYTMPARGDLWLIIVVGLLFAIGQTLNTTAYAIGGKPTTMACIGLTIPLFVSLYTYLFYKDDLPNIWQVVGYLIIAGGVLVLLKGNAQAAR